MLLNGVVVEGPDGGGKTTLIGVLKEAFPTLEVRPRAATSKGGPQGSMEKYILEEEKILAGMRWSLWDRHPIISEPIYGPLTRGGLDQSPDSGLRDPFWLRVHRNILARSAMTVFCLPPLEVVRSNVRRTAGDHMPGVEQHILPIWYGYHTLLSLWPSNYVHYDYADPHSLPMVLETIRIGVHHR